MMEERQIVVPGETIASGNEFLPGDGAWRDGTDVVAGRHGLADVQDKHVRVIPISGAYYPKRGNTIIGTVVDITFNGWLIDFGGAQNAFLGVSEVPRYINRNELREFLDFGESVVVKVWDVKSRGVDASMKMRGYGMIEGGMIVSISPNKVPRVIGREGSMVKMIKSATGCDVTVGQNGKVWVSGKDTDSEVATKKIIDFIAENATIVGLTERVEAFIKELGLQVSSAPAKPNDGVEVVEENTDSEENVEGDALSSVPSEEGKE
ncbi:KH domain-containing protein [archaeon]|jgi:exosome complex component RRP4|nr:KH domain-containing protein [archaeon]MBT3578341.1 KH domain-containing protein [archaeon]MBT6820126.1 KH domain-containing protein [archaeon]MBT6956350.1 KH domain-containing protein [archaeon]MBT7025477.1 KH domain-containing protein [archaeon]